MVNELDVPATDLWKYVDDTTISETISKNQDSHIHTAVDTLVNRASQKKCKELYLNFSTKEYHVFRLRCG